jgi:hypothetical protein
MSKQFSRVFLPALSFLIAAAAVPPILAQSKPAAIRTIMTYTVKSDRAGDMAAAIKEYNAILKKALWDKTYTMWRSTTGPAQLVRVDYHANWADLDAVTSKDPKLKEYQTELARITLRITESFLTSSRVVDMVNPEISLPRPAEMPKMIMVWTAHVKQGKMREAIAMEKNEYAPAVKSAGIKLYAFATTRFGAPANEVRSTTGLESWADLDQANPVRKGMGEEKYRAFSDKMGALLDDYRYEVFRYDSDLSYIAAK